MLYIAHPLHRRPAILAIVAVMLASVPRPAKAQAIVTNPNGSNQAVTFATPGIGLPTFAILFKGTSTTAPVMFGDGLRCCSGALRRLAAQNAVAGSFNFGYPTAKVSVAGHSPPGEHACYQLYYRDPNSSFCTTATFNITNSYQITWL